MSDWFESVVDVEVAGAEAEALAARVLAELVSMGFVHSERTNCALGGPGYPPQENVLTYLRAPDANLLRLVTNGLEVDIGRSVRMPTSLERIACPLCSASTTALDVLGWQDAVGRWYEGGEGELSCAGCARSSSVSHWIHEPPAGFGSLAFTFWNWPPFEPAYWTEHPVQVIEAVTKHRCIAVSGKL